jgi:hypothetical protein
MSHTDGIDCPLCSQEAGGRRELRIHLMVEHRKSTVIDEYVTHLDDTRRAADEQATRID